MLQLSCNFAFFTNFSCFQLEIFSVLFQKCRVNWHYANVCLGATW